MFILSDFLYLKVMLMIAESVTLFVQSVIKFNPPVKEERGYIKTYIRTPHS